MITYISILRGINVGGHKIIKMDALKDLYRSLGYKNVHSYIQSGNIIFQTTSNNTIRIAEDIQHAIHSQFGYDVPTIVKTRDEWSAIIQGQPFLKDETKDEKCVHVTILSSILHDLSSEKFLNYKSESEDIFITPQAVYLYCSQGYGQTQISNNLIEKMLQVPATTRNWKTIQKLWDLSHDM